MLHYKRPVGSYDRPVSPDSSFICRSPKNSLGTPKTSIFHTVEQENFANLRRREVRDRKISD